MLCWIFMVYENYFFCNLYSKELGSTLLQSVCCELDFWGLLPFLENSPHSEQRTFLFPDCCEIGTGEFHNKLTGPQEHHNDSVVATVIIFYFQAIIWYLSKKSSSSASKTYWDIPSQDAFLFSMYLKTSSWFSILEIFFILCFIPFPLYALVFISRIGYSLV